MTGPEQSGGSYGRQFFLAFSTAFFVLTLLLLFLVTMVPPQVPSQAAEAEAGDIDVDFGYQPTVEDAIAVLFVGTTSGGQEAGSFVLARFDPARGSVPIVSLPAHTAVNNRGKTETLATVYHYGGAEYTRDTLAASLGITIDRYVRMDDKVFAACANAIGSVEFELDREMRIQSGGAEMTLQQGKQLLDGQRAVALLDSPDLGEALERSGLLGDLTEAIVNQRIDICESALLDKVFSTIINLIDSDISTMDYQNRKQAGEYLAGLEQAPGISITPAGREEAGVYQLSDTFLALLRQTFS